MQLASALKRKKVSVKRLFQKADLRSHGRHGDGGGALPHAALLRALLSALPKFPKADMRLIAHALRNGDRRGGAAITAREFEGE